MKSSFSRWWVIGPVVALGGAAVLLIWQKYSGDREGLPAPHAELVASSQASSNTAGQTGMRLSTNQTALATRRAAVVQRGTDTPRADGGASDDTVPVLSDGSAASDLGTRIDSATLPAPAAIVPAPGPGDEPAIVGKVVLTGTPPPEKPLPIDLIKDPTCGKMHKEVPKTRFYLTGADGGLADVMIVVRSGPGIDGKTFESPAEPAHLDQVGCEYTPYIMGVQARQKLLVKNSDPFMHNVNVQPAVAGNKGSNKAQIANAKPFEYVFENPETFLRYRCDVHPWMFAYVTVVPHPYFAVTDQDGNFTIKNLPPGKYVVEAIHRKTHPNGKGITQEVTVDAGTAQPVEFRLEAPTE